MSEQWGDKELSSEEIDRVADKKLWRVAFPTITLIALVCGGGVALIVSMLGGNEPIVMVSFFCSAFGLFMALVLHAQLLLAIVAESYKIRHGIRD